MTDFGAVIDARAVRFECVLPGPIERVWAYLTESEKRRKWLASGEMELRVGGRVELHFLHSELTPHKEEPPEQYKKFEKGVSAAGVITRYEPPRALAMSWGGEPDKASEVTFELTPQGADVLLVLTHRRLPNRDEMVETSGGWHSHLDVLVEHLNGRTPQPFWAAVERNEKAYQKRIPAE